MPSGERFKCHLVRARVVPVLWTPAAMETPSVGCSFSPPHLWQMSINEDTDGRNASAPSGVA